MNNNMNNMNIPEIEAHILNANTVKKMVLETLKNDGIISEEQEKKYSEEWHVILIKTSWFKNLINKFKKGDDYEYRYVKL